MTNFHRLIFPFLDTLLRGNKDLNILMGIVLGTFLGMFPFATLQWLFSILAFMFLRANLLAFLTTFTFCYVVGMAGDPLWNSIGFRLLTNRPDLYPMWGWMHHAPIIPFTDFTNTVVLGVSLAALILGPTLAVVYFVSKAKIRHGISKLWYQTKISRFYAHYRKY